MQIKDILVVRVATYLYRPVRSGTVHILSKSLIGRSKTKGETK